MPKTAGASKALIQTIKTILSGAGYSVRTGLDIGEGPGGTGFKPKVIGWYGTNTPFLVSCHSQSHSGSTEAKIPFDVIAYATALDNHPGKFAKAYIVLDGQGWDRLDYFVGGGMNRYFRNTENVKIVTLNQFRDLANQHAL